MTGTSAGDTPDIDNVSERLQRAFIAIGAAREELDKREDNARALVVEAFSAGLTWVELEQLSGLSDISLLHRYGPSSAPEPTPIPAGDLIGMPQGWGL